MSMNSCKENISDEKAMLSYVCLCDTDGYAATNLDISTNDTDARCNESKEKALEKVLESGGQSCASHVAPILTFLLFLTRNYIQCGK